MPNIACLAPLGAQRLQDFWGVYQRIGICKPFRVIAKKALALNLRNVAKTSQSDTELMPSFLFAPVQNNSVRPDIVVDKARLVHFIKCTNNFMSRARHLDLRQNPRGGHVPLQITDIHFYCDHEDIGSLSEIFNGFDDVFACTQ